MVIRNSIFKKLLLLCFVVVVISCNNSNVLELATRGKSNYEIIVPSESSELVKFSALELQQYLLKISGVKIPIVANGTENKKKSKIRLQVNAADEHQVLFKNSEKDLIIRAGSDTALKNAVYEFLEIYLECKFYSPTVEAIPLHDEIAIAIPIDYKYTPEVTTRTVHSSLFYDNSTFAGKHKVTSESFPYYVPKARVHTFHRFIPEEKFFKEHPEYFALRGGKRIPTQLCLTNESVLNIVKDSVASLFNQYPEATVVSVSQDDNTQYCQCEQCSIIDKAEGSPAGKTIYFVNEVAKSFPNKTISTLAYQHTRKAPKVKPLDNVLITLCSIECDRSAPIEEKCTDFAEDVIAWGKLTSNIRIWDYTTQFTNFLAPFPNLHTLQPNIQFLRDQHTKWIFEQHSNHPSELFELRSYILAKLLWNPDQDFNALVKEFTDGYYKEAGVHVRKYIELVHEKLKEDQDFYLFLYGDPSQAFDSYLSPALLNQYNQFFDDAEKAVAYDKEIVARVKSARLSIDFAILEACKKGGNEQFSLTLKNEKGAAIANTNTQERLESFYATCKREHITLMNEMGFKVDAYYSSYKKAIEVALLPNKAKGKKVCLLTKPKKYANKDPQTLTDGALGGNNFYANWLGFEGEDLGAVIDLEKVEAISSIAMAYLKVTNHVVFYPNKVTYYGSKDNKHFVKLGSVLNKDPLTKKTKKNEIQYFNLQFLKSDARYIKVVAESMKQAPYWHHASGSNSWIFADEIIIN